MSEVWAATDLDLDREVAVKLVGAHADPARFQREARAVAALAHPSICTLYSYGETNGRPFIVLEYLPGGSLEERLAPGRPLPDDVTAHVAAEVASGLAHAHERGVVHRDLKPQNILFDAQGRAKIADFGIAQVGHDSGLTETGTVFGTAAYLSPEQAAGEPATAASDVYAFGVILFRMLTGRLPFEGDDALTVAAMHRDRPAPSVTSLRPDAPAALESIAAAALAKSPFDRPRNGGALLAELADVVRHPAAETAVTQILQPAPKRRRTALVVLVAAILAAAGAAVAVALTLRSGNAGAPTSTTRPTASVPRTTAATPAPPPATAAPQTETEQTTRLPSTSAATAGVPGFPTTPAPPTTAPPSDDAADIDPTCDDRGDAASDAPHVDGVAPDVDDRRRPNRDDANGNHADCDRGHKHPAVTTAPAPFEPSG